MKKSIYGMNNYGKLFADDLDNWMIDQAGFKQSQCLISIYYKYAPDGSRLVVLSYVDDCVYWYTSEEIVKQFLYTLGKILHVKFLVYSRWFISIRISQLKYYYISIYQARYATYIVERYLDTATMKENSTFHKTKLSHDMIFTK